MRATADRRLAIRDYISERRHTTIAELIQEFHVSKSTVLRDLEALTENTSFYTTPGNGGGIHATEGWYASRRYLSATGLQTESEKKLMESILLAFAKPTHE